MLSPAIQLVDTTNLQSHATSVPTSSQPQRMNDSSQSYVPASSPRSSSESVSRLSSQSPNRNPTVITSKPSDSLEVPLHTPLVSNTLENQGAVNASKVEALCKSLGVAVFYNTIARLVGKPCEEEPKVALWKNRSRAITHCAIHLIPVVTAIVIIVLNLMQYYIGGELSGRSGEDFEKLAALQYTAKLHELMMLASVATVLFTYIRQELLQGEGLPFGAVFASLQFTTISFLWSREMLGVLKNRWSKGQRKIFMICLLILCTILGVSVGPSTATLMRPRLDNWPAGGTRFWLNGSEADIMPTGVSAIFPLSHCSQDSGDPACPHGGWRQLSDNLLSFWPQLQPTGALPRYIRLTSSYAVRELEFGYRSTSDNTESIYSSPSTMATVPPAAVSDALSQLALLWAVAAEAMGDKSRLKFRLENTFAVETRQPLVSARCVKSHVSPLLLETVSFSFPMSGDQGTAHLTRSNITTPESATQFLDISSPPGVSWWSDDSLREMTNSTANAVAFIPSPQDDGKDVYCCSLDTRSAPVSLNGSWTHTKIIQADPYYDWRNFGLMHSDLPIISIDTAWAEHLLPSAVGSNASVFGQMAAAAGLWNSSIPAQEYNSEFIVESVLATLIADGIARWSYNRTVVGTLRGADPSNPWRGGTWEKYMIPRGGMAWESKTSIYSLTPEQEPASTQFTMRATDLGYAYSRAGGAQIASMIVLVVYCLLSLSHVVYSWWTGWTSNGWDTAPEVVALAMASENSEILRNTSAGISTCNVFEERVWIRDRNGHCEYVFKDHQYAGRKVMCSTAYA